MERCVWKSVSGVEMDDISGEKETERGNSWLREWEEKRKQESKNRRITQKEIIQGVDSVRSEE